ncbi:unnamed protein product [Orchesella dallaii]|uniref:Elongation of very long chain fatty acids protein n=1 Tax=Orchesella dallaii TaxID=48710 RepID=A0ABP1S0K9_9HEXA
MATKFIEVPLVENTFGLKLFDYEKNFPLTYWRQVFGDYWTISAYTSALYVILLFGGRWYMSSRAPFKLNKLLTIWNVGLAIMSIYAFCRVAPEFIFVMLGKNGFHNTICEWPEHNGATAFWSWILALSKIVELGDTAFIVLRKQNLLFLHWYHHVTTLMSWWVMYHWYEPVQQWYVVMNSFVHSFMYTYYALRSLKIRVPRPIAMFITTIQLLQMVAGVTVSLYSYWIMSENPANCPHRNWFGLKVSFAIYVPYTILFAKLFIDSYLVKPRKGPGPGASEKNGSLKNGNGVQTSRTEKKQA